MSRSRVGVLRDRIVSSVGMRTLASLAWPLVLSSYIGILYNVVDSIWLGRLGRAAFSAPISVFPVLLVVYSIGNALTMAVSTLVGQLVGGKRFDEIRKTVSRGLALVLVVAIVSAASLFLSIPILVSAIGIPEDVAPYAVIYTRILSISAPFAFVRIFFSQCMRAYGDTKASTMVFAASVATNIALDPILIFGFSIPSIGLYIPRMGVAGAAIATNVSEVVGAATALGIYMSRYGEFMPIAREARPTKDWIAKVLRIALPMAVHQLCVGIGFTLMIAVVSVFGSPALAAYGVGIRVLDIMTPIISGFAGALAIAVAQCIGAERYENALRYSRIALIYVTLGISIASILTAVYGGSIASVFVSDRLAVEESRRMLAIFAPSIPFFAVFTLIGGVARGSGHVKIFTIVGVARILAIRLPLAYVLAILLGFGTVGIWIAMTISNIVASILAIVWYTRMKWLRKVI